MFWLIGLIGGFIVGGLLMGFGGAVVLGFLGWLFGIIIGAARRAKAPSAPVAPVVHPQARQEDSDLARMGRIEARLAAVEARLARLDGAAATVDRPAAAETPVAPEVQPEPFAPSEPAAQPEPFQRTQPIPVFTQAEAQAPETAQAQATPRPVLPPREPERPNPIVAWFTGGNTIVRVGLVILFVGLAFLLKYASDHQMLPDELKVAGVAAGGIALLFIGWRLRDKRRGYALSLLGAGVAVLYLTILGAMRLYSLVPPVVAFFLLAAIAVFAAVLAITQDALALAVIGAGGGFLAPILVSTGQGSHVTLFSYYLVLNAGIVLVAWFKAWRVLNVVGFLFTFFIGLAWGLRSYRPDYFASVEAFLVAFFLLYVAIALMFARREVAALRSYVDGTIVFGTPLAAFGLQAGLTRDIEYGLAFSSLALAAFYVFLAAVLFRVRRESWRMLTESFLAMGVVFATLAIPLALDARWTSAAWALEGAAIYWIGIRQRRGLARAFALFLELAAGAAFIHAYPRMSADIPLADAVFIGAMLVALAGLWTHRMIAKAGDVVGEGERQLSPFAFLWGLAWLLFAGVHEIDAFVAARLQPAASVAFFTAIAAAFAFLHVKRGWREGAWPFRALLPVLVAVAAWSALEQDHPLANFGWLAWPFAFVAHTVMLRRLGPEQPTSGFSILHVGAYLLLAVLGAWEMNWAAAEVTAHGTAWSVAAVLVVPAALVYWASSARWDERWPIDPFGEAYRNGGALALVILMGLWTLYVNATCDGRSDPLPYLPLLNAVDLGHALVALAGASLWLCARRTGLRRPALFHGPPARVVVAALAFVWINAILLRTIHHWAGVPYALDTMMRSVLVQTALSVFWTLLALALMVFATRRGARGLWMVGAALMGVVVVKLFLVDLSNIGGIERIVSFIGVGVLMLVIGYFSPVPPHRPEEKP
jgi:uncharacterized membrane protein